MKGITSKELKDKIQSKEDIQLIDVRTPEEYSQGTIGDAPLIPHTKIEQRVENVFPDHDKEYILFCRTDGRSQIAAQIMGSLGYTNVSFLKGGHSHFN